MSELKILNQNRLKFEFENETFDVDHISMKKLPYSQRKFIGKGFELYSNSNRDSWTNELILILNDNSHGITQITHERENIGSLEYGEEITIFGEEKDKIICVNFDVENGSQERLQQILKFNGVSG